MKYNSRVVVSTGKKSTVSLHSMTWSAKEIVIKLWMPRQLHNAAQTCLEMPIVHRLLTAEVCAS